jgi:hypothetical protein
MNDADGAEGATLEQAIAAIESRLSALGQALRGRDAAAIEQHAQELQVALAGAIQRCTRAARQPGGVPVALRRRLEVASGQVAVQRDTLVRATAALDRALGVLMPVPEQSPGYAPHGASLRANRGGGGIDA